MKLNEIADRGQIRVWDAGRPMKSGRPLWVMAKDKTLITIEGEQSGLNINDLHDEDVSGKPPAPRIEVGWSKPGQREPEREFLPDTPEGYEAAKKRMMELMKT